MPMSTAQSRNGWGTGNRTAWGMEGIDRVGGERTRNGERGGGRRRGGKRGGEDKRQPLVGNANKYQGSTKEEVLIRFGTYNIRNGRNRRL